MPLQHTLFSKQVRLLDALSSILARCQGLEPQSSGPEPLVLPLHQLRIYGVTEENRTPMIGITTRRFAIKLQPTYLAEGKGFEPLEAVTLLQFSRLVRSAALPTFYVNPNTICSPRLLLCFAILSSLHRTTAGLCSDFGVPRRIRTFT